MADDDPLQAAGESNPSDPQDPWIGQMVGNYVLIQLLGHGGMGVVYLARHESLDRLAAAKFLSAEMAADAEYVERFLREAKLAAKLSHNNIIHVHDAGSLGENIHFIIMEYVEGCDLGSLLNELGVIPVPTAVACIQQAADALGYAHKKHIIHRDIKPGNLMLTPAGAIKVGDLGLAKSVEFESDVSLTQPMTVVGTAAYMSPEQVRGSKNVDSRTDIYSLGATFYHLVTGKLPYEDTILAVVMDKLLNHPAPEPHHANPKLDADICKIIKKMMAKKLEDRFQTMEEVVAVLGKYQSRTTHPEQPISELVAIVPDKLFHDPRVSRKIAAVSARPKPSAKKALIIGACVLVAGLAGYLAAVFAPHHDEAATPVEASKPAEPEAPPTPPPSAVAATTTTETAKETGETSKPIDGTDARLFGSLMIADFEKSSFMNNVGGLMRGFASQKPPAKSKFSVTNLQAGPDGVPTKGLQIEYDISNPGSWAGCRMDLAKLDTTDYRTISLKVKNGVEKQKTTFSLVLEVLTPNPYRKSVVIRDIGDEWKTLNIPLADFGLPQHKPLNGMGFLFNEITARDTTKGVVLIDDVMLLK